MRSLARRLESSLPGSQLDLIRSAGRLASGFGARAYLVGGSVRDLLLGRPSEDLDIAVEGDALRLARALAGPSGRAATLHERFGTASLLAEGGVRLDLAATRRETYAAPAALPTVAPGDIVQDLERRDFTVNAIALRLDPEEFGRVVDPFGGRQDLRLRLIRILHDQSFIDDPTRAFRAIRLATSLGFDLDRRTRERLRAAVRERGSDRLSSARLRKEVMRAFSGPHAAEVVQRLARCGLLGALHPSLLLPRSARVRLERCVEELAAERAGRPVVDSTGWAIALAIVLTGASRTVRTASATRLGADRRIRHLLIEGPVRAGRIARSLAGPRARRASFIYELCRPEPAEVLLLAAALSARGAATRAVSSYFDELRDTRAEIGGDDLLRAGLPAGPRIARGLAAALRAKLDGRAPDAASQLRIALRAAGSA